jgi:nitrite reductase (NO-forming)
MQGDLYTKHAHGTKTHQEFDTAKMANEMPDYFVFNGAVGSLTKEHKMTAETVRLFFGVGGPNKISSFHVIGEIFDKVYSEGSLTTIKKDVQTTLVPAGGATIVEMSSTCWWTNALSRAGKGLVGAITVTGGADKSIYNGDAKGPAH